MIQPLQLFVHCRVGFVLPLSAEWAVDTLEGHPLRQFSRTDSRESLGNRSPSECEGESEVEDPFGPSVKSSVNSSMSESLRPFISWHLSNTRPSALADRSPSILTSPELNSRLPCSSTAHHVTMRARKFSMFGRLLFPFGAMDASNRSRSVPLRPFSRRTQESGSGSPSGAHSGTGTSSYAWSLALWISSRPRYGIAISPRFGPAITRLFGADRCGSVRREEPGDPHRTRFLPRWCSLGQFPARPMVSAASSKISSILRWIIGCPVAMVSRNQLPPVSCSTHTCRLPNTG